MGLFRSMVCYSKCCRQFLKDVFGEEVSVDTRRVQFEAAALQKLYEIQPCSVPKVILVDPSSNSSEHGCMVRAVAPVYITAAALHLTAL